jgi:Zn-dependent protease
MMNATERPRGAGGASAKYARRPGGCQASAWLYTPLSSGYLSATSRPPDDSGLPHARAGPRDRAVRPTRSVRRPSHTPPLDSQAIQTFILAAPVLLFSVIAHEVAHGYAALKQGDDTALMLGRLTFNPIKHIDPFMTILLPIILAVSGAPILGGAKPVPVNPRKYRRFKRGDIIVSLAGIATNLALAVICTILIILIGFIPLTPSTAETQALLQAMMGWGIYLNLTLAAFNLLPVPPLDGSHVLKYILPPGWALGYQRVGFFGIIVIIFLLRTPILTWWLYPAFALTNGAFHLAEATSMLIPHVLAPWGGPPP